MISAIDQLPPAKSGTAFFLFLPESEHHELGCCLYITC
jgi:hypothetical protein